MRVTRLEFLKAVAVSGAGFFLPGRLRAAEGRIGPDTARAPKRRGESMLGVAFAPRERVRLGVIGVGGRGSSLLTQFLATGHVDVTAVCDIVPEKVARAQKTVTEAGQPEPAAYTKGDRDYENLLRRDDTDLALIATPWDWHVPMALFAMEQGIHAAVEVPAAVTLEDCWKLVDASERTRRHCVMLENCCYGDSEMMVLNMVRKGVFGELIHGEAAYIHDLRGELFSNAGEGLWRRTEHTERDGNLYPTHGLGPVAQYMGINRTDRFESIVSMSSMERGLSIHRAKHEPKDSPKWRERYVCGDINTSLIRTRLGRTIMLQHDTVSPRPYSRHNMISGTKGTFADYPARIFLDGQGHDWQDVGPYREKYRHPLWQTSGETARKLGGHGGMDFLMAYRLIECMRNGEAPDMDVYDAAAWSAPGPLSVLSVANGGAAVAFPDFTRRSL